MRAALAVAAALLLAPATALAQTETVTQGPVTASFSFEQSGEIGFQNEHITVDRGGVRMVDEEVDPAFAWPAGHGNAESPSISLRDLTGDEEPEVIVDLFTGGANCCFLSFVYRYLEATNTYKKSQLFPGGNFPYSLKDVDKDGVPEFHSIDSRFAYKYGANIETPRPLRIFSFEKGRLVDITLAFKKLAAKDAVVYYKEYLQIRREKDFNVRGIIAAYLADEYRAGRGRIGWRRVVAAYRRGDLNKQREFDVGPYGRKYLKDLRRFLARLGYLKRP